MSALNASQVTEHGSKSFSNQLANGSTLTYTEIDDEDFAIRYEVYLDGTHLGLLALWFIEPLTETKAWISAVNDDFWSPITSNLREAVTFLIPPEPAC